MAVSNKVSKKALHCAIVMVSLFVLHFVGGNRTVDLAELTSTSINANVNHDNSSVVDVTTVTSITMPPSTQWTQLTDDINNECLLSAVDPLTHNTIEQLVKDKVSLIEYRLKFLNYSFNPLTTNVSWLYSGDKWSRVTTSHGQTLLSLAFNYGVLSMMTLTFGTVKLDVTLADSPPGCLATIPDEHQRVDVILRLLMRDFRGTSSSSNPSTFNNDERICHEVIEDQNADGYAEFRDRCCFRDVVVGVRDAVACTSNIENFYLSLLYGLLTTIRFLLLLFGPLLFIDVVNNISSISVPYGVKLRDALVKTIVVCRKSFELDEIPNYFRRRGEAESGPRPIPLLDLHSHDGFPKLISAAESIPTGQAVQVRFQRYDINVDYQRTMTENLVEVGLFQTIVRSLFGCRLRHIGPFKTCCSANILMSCSKHSSDNKETRKRRVPWIWFWRYVSNVLLVVLLPLPYYIRLVIYYVYERDEVMRRKEATNYNGLKESFESSMIQYFTPLHPLFIAIYLIYFTTTFLLTISSKLSKKNRGHLQKIVYGCFKDLKSLDWTDTLDTIVSNLVWPFERFGGLGCLVCVVYWPIVMPLTVLVALVYVVPTIYLTMRMVYYCMSAIRVTRHRWKKIRRYRANASVDRSVRRFRIEEHFPSNREAHHETDPDDDDDIDVDIVESKEHIRKMSTSVSLASSTQTVILQKTYSVIRIVGYASLAAVCILNLYATMIILSEVVGCLVEVAVFTVMGVVVNASELLKYVMLILMVVVHVCDCFNSVEKKYLKLNKALFGEVKSRIRDLSDVTSLPSQLQENFGFKAQELSEQAEYESPDDLVEHPARHWMINDLVLFVDSEDTPRIPKHLFDQVCDIRVAGVPGPVFRGQLEAIREVFKIGAFLGFVFLVVLSFSAVYKLSHTNQMLATVVGGFLPMILRTFVKSPPPDIELGTVSFKSKMDEVIKNFRQYWPIYDLPFELVTEGEGSSNDDASAARKTARPDDEPTEADRECERKISCNGNALHTESWNETCNVGHGDDLMTVIHLFPAEKKSERTTDYSRSSITKWKAYVDEKKKKPSMRRQTSSGSTRKAHASKMVSLNVDENGRPRQEIDRQEIDLVVYLPDPHSFGGWLDEWSDNQSVKLPIT